MKPFCFLSVLLIIHSAFGQVPSASAIVNGASNVPAPLPNSAIAQGAIFVIYGSNLGPEKLVQASTFPLSSDYGLAGTIVRIQVGTQVLAAPLLYSSATQVAGILPSKMALGAGSVTVTYNGQTSDPLSVQTTLNNFGLATSGTGGIGYAVATNTDGSLVTVFHSAKPGDTVTLWGTGLGAAPGDDVNRPQPVDLSLPIELDIGMTSGKITYAGRSSCCAGLDQVNFVVPSGVEGCMVPVSLTVNGHTSTYAPMPIASGGGICSAPDGITSLLSKVLANGSATMATLSLGHISQTGAVLTTPSTIPYTVGTANAGFFRVSADTYLTSAVSDVPLGMCSTLR